MSAAGPCLLDVNTLAETSAYLRLTDRQVSQLARDKKLAGIQVGRRWIFTREAIRAYLEQNAPAVAATGKAPTAPVPPRRVGRKF